MPISSAFCCFSRGTLKLDMITSKANTLSTDSAFSVR
jgi:hypothetical protein